jgi:hypothetical protein
MSQSTPWQQRTNASPTQTQPDEDDILRIMVTTDNHLVRPSMLQPIELEGKTLTDLPSHYCRHVRTKYLCAWMLTSLAVQGVCEGDEWRGSDSFESFREVFRLAREHKVDMVLLGGDLFHKNNPSRHTLVEALGILNEHCLDDSPIRFQVCSRLQRVNTSSSSHHTAHSHLRCQHLAAQCSALHTHSQRGTCMALCMYA